MMYSQSPSCRSKVNRVSGLVTSTFTLCLFAALLGGTNVADALTLYASDFNAPTYTDGALIGQDGWLITGTNVTNPISVANTATDGDVSLTTTGQDANRPFGPAVTSGSVFLSADVVVTAAQATGDYFLHFSDGTTTSFFNRVYARASAGGFQMALGTSSGTTTLAYGTTELTLGTSYHILARYDFVAGDANDTGALFVNPTDPFGVGDTPYVSATTTGTDAVSISAMNLRQGTSANAATVTLDNLSADIVPEPGFLAIIAAGLSWISLIARRRR